MIIVIFLVCVALLVLGAILYKYFDCDTAGGITMACGVIGGIISFIVLIFLLVDVSGLRVIDQKIDMYQEENARIETQIVECIEQYQKYETDIFTNVSSESAITLVSLYPDLKSDILVSKQIEIYIANNEKIKELKEMKLVGDVNRWWLYFG